MLKHKSYSMAALFVTTIIFRGGRSFGDEGFRSPLDEEFAKPLELLRLVHSASTSCQISSTITAAKPVHRKDTARSVSTMFELISLSLTSQIQIVELSREISSLGVVYR